MPGGSLYRLLKAVTRTPSIADGASYPRLLIYFYMAYFFKCREADSNCPRKDFQSFALPLSYPGETKTAMCTFENNNITNDYV